MRINSTEGRLKSVTASRQGGKSNCNGSLAYGDISFGDGELNQGLVALSTRLNRSKSLTSLKMA